MDEQPIAQPVTDLAEDDPRQPTASSSASDPNGEASRAECDDCDD